MLHTSHNRRPSYNTSHVKACYFFAAFVAALLLSTETGRAAVGYRFSGVVTEVATELSSEFSVGEVVRGRVWVAATPRSGCSICLGDTYDTRNLTATIGGDYVLNSPVGQLTVINDFAGFDIVKLDTTAPLGLSGPAVNGHVPDYFNFGLRYNISDLSSTNLLDQFAPATAFDGSGLRFDIDDSLNVSFRLTDFSVVPEPSSWALVNLAVFFASLRRCARYQRGAAF